MTRPPDLLVQFFGSGYAWTNVTKRLGFDAAGVVEYDPDFLLDGSTMYLYFRTKHVAATSFQAGMIENPAANLAMVMAPGGFAEKFGRQVSAEELTRGFTVIRKDDGTVDLAGNRGQGKEPFHPYQIKDKKLATLANERIEVHSGRARVPRPLRSRFAGQVAFLHRRSRWSRGGRPLGRTQGRRRSVAVALHPPTRHHAADLPASHERRGHARCRRIRKALQSRKGRYYLVVDNRDGGAPPQTPRRSSRAGQLRGPSRGRAVRGRVVLHLGPGKLRYPRASHDTGGSCACGVEARKSAGGAPSRMARVVALGIAASLPSAYRYPVGAPENQTMTREC